MSVLCMLAHAQGQVIARDDLLDAVWDTLEVTEQVLTRTISLLRKAFKQLAPDVPLIQTVSKSGYRVAQPIVWDKSTPHAKYVINHTAMTRSKDAYHLYVQARSLNQRINGRTELPVAHDLLHQAIKLDPDFAHAHAELANSYTLMGTYVPDAATLENLEAAEHHARRALELDPDLTDAMITLSIAHFTRGCVVDAILLVTQATILAPESSEAVMRLGYFYAAIGHTRTAIPLLERAVGMDPAQGRNLQVLALAKLCNGDFDEAEILAKRAIDLHHTFAYDTYSGVAFAQGHYDLACARFVQGGAETEWMVGAAYSLETWTQIGEMATSPVREYRLAHSAMLVDKMDVPGRTPDLALLQGVLRCGDADNFFRLAMTYLPIGRHGSYLCLWVDTEPCRDIYLHAKFPQFAEHAGFQNAWEKWGAADKLQA